MNTVTFAARALALILVGIGYANGAAFSGLKPMSTYDVEEAEVVFATRDGLELRARTYRPKVTGVLPAIIDVHGGAWNTGDRNQGQIYDRGLASTGLFVFAIDFRQGPKFQHPAANRDIATAVRYLHAQARTLQIDATSLGLVGSSSGGHLAMLSGLRPNSNEYREGGATDDASVRYVIALWPVSDPAYRYDYAKRVGRTELLRSHEAFFGTRDEMQRASVTRVVRAGEQTHLPPLLVVQPGKDANIPIEMTFDLMKSYQDAGGRLEYLFYPQQPHAFGHRPSADTNHLIAAMKDFVERTLHSK